MSKAGSRTAERLYKFLRPNAVAPFSGVTWRAGEWVEAHGQLVACVNGVHVCRIRDLPYWLADELWEVEVAGERREGAQKLVVERACLRERVEGWPRPIARALATDCLWRVRNLAVAELRRLNEREADELEACSGIRELKEVAERAARRRRPDRPAAAADYIGFVLDACSFAPERAARAARYISYVAAHAADRATPDRRLAPGESRFASERSRQARLLEGLLG